MREAVVMSLAVLGGLAGVSCGSGGGDDSGEASAAGGASSAAGDGGREDLGDGGGGAGGDPGSGGAIAEPFNRYSLKLDGQSGFASLGNSSDVIPTGLDPLTVSLWVRLGAEVDLSDISGKGILSINATGAFGEGLDLLWSTELEDHSIALYAPGQAPGGYRVPVENALDWHHVVVVIDAESAGEGFLYLDGEAMDPISLEPNQEVAAAEIWLGKYLNDAFLMDGYIDELGIWDVALGAEAVAAIFNEGTPTPLTETVGAYTEVQSLIQYNRMGDYGSGSILPHEIGGGSIELTGGAEVAEETP